MVKNTVSSVLLLGVHVQSKTFLIHPNVVHDFLIFLYNILWIEMIILSKAMSVSIKYHFFCYILSVFDFC